MSVNVSAEDKTKFIQQDLEEYVNLCDKSFQEHKFDCAEAGLKIGHVIISEFLKERIASTPANQQVSANNEDIFKMLNVLAKTNATAITTIKRAKYHEDLTRTLTANLNHIQTNVKRDGSSF